MNNSQAGSLTQLSPETLATTPALAPPPGVTPNPEHPIITLFAGFLCAVVIYIGQILFVAPGGNLGVHQWDLSLAQLFSRRTLIPLFVLSYITHPAFGFVKLSVFMMYLEIFVGLRWMRICVYIGATISSTFYLTLTILVLCLGTPIGGESWQSLLLTSRWKTVKLLAYPSSSVGLAIDIYLFILPLVAVKNLRIPTRKKALMMIGLGTGLLACIASALGIVYRSAVNRSPDTTWWIVPVSIAAMVELFSGIIICCFPSLLLFFRTYSNQFVKMGARLLYWLSCTKYKKSSTPASDSHELDHGAQSPQPIVDNNLYPGLDTRGTLEVTTSDDIECGCSDSTVMQTKFGKDAEGPVDVMAKC
ncbi:hypothetical protein EYC80_001741 [Monilinia laxa]|uniref:Rhodopsin domain-containing protein n=1 Tax=Monilinia laxa TaxID=61186 RepID=A0A5N6K5W3_MONLA|nr:hypothetical protein EYC80_001741 [Monilinia laxa]